MRCCANTPAPLSLSHGNDETPTAERGDRCEGKRIEGKIEIEFIFSSSFERELLLFVWRRGYGSAMHYCSTSVGFGFYTMLELYMASKINNS